MFLRNARIDRTDEDTNFLVVVAKVSGGAEEELQVSAVSVRAALDDSMDADDDADTFSAAGITDSVIACSTHAPLSSKVVGDSNISRHEVEEFLMGAGVADLHVGADSGERDVFFRFSVRSICSAAENAGQSLDSGKLPTVPFGRGKVLAEAGENSPPARTKTRTTLRRIYTLYQSFWRNG